MNITENPHFRNVERAPYELGHLLKQLSPAFSERGEATPGDRLIAEAAMRHAENASHTVICGLEALGQVIFVAGANEENRIDGQTLASLGYLIKHLAVEAQFLHETEWTIHEELVTRDAAAKSKGGK